MFDATLLDRQAPTATTSTHGPPPPTTQLVQTAVTKAQSRSATAARRVGRRPAVASSMASSRPSARRLVAVPAAGTLRAASRREGHRWSPKDGAGAGVPLRLERPTARWPGYGS